jgi:hypothetical protein
MTVLSIGFMKESLNSIDVLENAVISLVASLMFVELHLFELTPLRSISCEENGYIGCDGKEGIPW